MINPSQRPLPDNTQHSQQTNIHAPGGIRTHNLIRGAAEDLGLRPRGQWDRFLCLLLNVNILHWTDLEPVKYVCLLSNEPVLISTFFFTLSIHIFRAMKINPGKSKAPSFTRARVKGHLNYSFGEPKNSGKDQLHIVMNKLTRRFKLG